MTLDAQGNFYGTSSAGGAYGDGMLWEIVRGSNTVTTLVSFNGSNKSPSPGGLAVDGDGNIFGATALGGTYGFGTFWEFIVGTVASVRAVN